MKRKWTKQSLKKALFSVGGRALALLLCLCSALSFCLPASALNLNVSMTGYYESSDSSNVCWQYSFISSNYTCGQYVGHTQPSNGYADGVWRVRDSANSGYTLKANSISQVYVWFIGGSLEQSYSSGASFRLLSSEIVGTVGDRTEYVFTLLNTSATQNAHIQFGTSWRTGTGGSVFAYVSNVVTFSPDGYVDHDYTSLLNVLSQNVANQSQILSDIRNMTNDTNLRLDDIIANTDGLGTALGNVNSGLSTVNQSVIAQGQATQNAINAQTEQQEEQYEQEKQEESDREEQGQEDSETAQGLFSFSVFNPFGGIFGLFSDGCVSIPTIGGMLNKPDATYCPWFSSNIRSVLTPVLGLSASMLLFGFVVRWLSGNSGDIYGARNLGKELS